MTAQEIIATIRAEIERRMKILHEDEVVRQNCTSAFLEGKIYGYEEVLSFLDTLEESVAGLEIVKEARITPGMLSNFGSSSFVIDVELTQEERSKLHLAPGFGSCGVKIKIVCE